MSTSPARPVLNRPVLDRAVGETVADAALSLVGTRYRLHGRSQETGLDCIGVLNVVLGRTGTCPPLPNGYALRSTATPDIARFAAACGLIPAEGHRQPGDVLVLRPGPLQIHLAIAADARRVVHAHAGLRKVVVSQLPASWSLLSIWRLAPKI